MRIVALEAISHRGRMHRPFDLSSIFVGVARQAKSVRSSGDQLHASDVFVNSNLMAGGAAHGNGRMHRFAFGFIFMAGKARRRISFRIERHWMLDGESRANEKNKKENAVLQLMQCSLRT